MAPALQRSRDMGALIDHVRSYYEALNTGDADKVAEHFTEDAVHYYTRLGPHEGREAIAGYAAMGVEHIEGEWFLEDAIEDGERVVIEWTMTWRDPGVGRAAARPGHRVVRVPGREDLRGAGLPPRQQEEPSGQSARVRPRGSRLHDAVSTHTSIPEKRQPHPALHRGARGAARVDPALRGEESCAPTRSSGRTSAGFRTRCSKSSRRSASLGLEYP